MFLRCPDPRMMPSKLHPAVAPVVTPLPAARRGLFFHAPAGAAAAAASNGRRSRGSGSGGGCSRASGCPSHGAGAGCSGGAGICSGCFARLGAGLARRCSAGGGTGRARSSATPNPPKQKIPAANLDESIEEVRFYLGQGMTDQAEELLVKLEAMAPEAPEVAVLRLAVDSAKQAVALPDLESEISIEEPEAAEAPYAAEEPEAAAPTPTIPAPAPAPKSHFTPQPWPQERPVLHQMVSEIEQSLGDEFLAEPKKARSRRSLKEPSRKRSTLRAASFARERWTILFLIWKPLWAVIFRTLPPPAPQSRRRPVLKRQSRGRQQQRRLQHHFHRSRFSSRCQQASHQFADIGAATRAQRLQHGLRASRFSLRNPK